MQSKKHLLLISQTHSFEVSRDALLRSLKMTSQLTTWANQSGVIVREYQPTARTYTAHDLPSLWVDLTAACTHGPWPRSHHGKFLGIAVVYSNRVRIVPLARHRIHSFQDAIDSATIRAQGKQNAIALQTRRWQARIEAEQRLPMTDGNQKRNELREASAYGHHRT